MKLPFSVGSCSSLVKLNVRANQQTICVDSTVFHQRKINFFQFLWHVTFYEHVVIYVLLLICEL